MKHKSVLKPPEYNMWRHDIIYACFIQWPCRFSTPAMNYLSKKLLTCHNKTRRFGYCWRSSSRFLEMDMVFSRGRWKLVRSPIYLFYSLKSNSDITIIEENLMYSNNRTQKVVSTYTRPIYSNCPIMFFIQQRIYYITKFNITSLYYKNYHHHVSLQSECCTKACGDF